MSSPEAIAISVIMIGFFVFLGWTLWLSNKG